MLMKSTVNQIPRKLNIPRLKMQNFKKVTNIFLVKSNSYPTIYILVINSNEIT